MSGVAELNAALARFDGRGKYVDYELRYTDSLWQSANRYWTTGQKQDK